MPKVAMLASMRQTYEGRALKTGDPFEASSEEEARDLEAVNAATRDKSKVGRVMSRVMTSQPETKVADSEDDAAKIDSPDTTQSSPTQPVRQASTKGGSYNRSDVRSGR